MATRPDPAPLQTNDVKITAGGTGLWVLALVVLLVLKATDATDVHGWWLAMCGYGIALGLLGVRTTWRRQLARGRSD